jgi:hypothetical protein
LAQYKEFLLKWEVQCLALKFPTFEESEDLEWMKKFYLLRSLFVEEIHEVYPPSEKGESNNDKFRECCFNLVNVWEFADNTIYVEENREEIAAICNGNYNVV